MGSGRSGLYSGASPAGLSPVAGDLVLRSPQYDYFDYMSRRKDVDPDGKLDIVAHGSSEIIKLEINGKELLVDARTISRILAHSKKHKKKQPIRLLSCETGSKADGFAQNLANKLNTIVYAPTELVWAFPSGRHIVAPRDPNKPDHPHPTLRGSFIPFYPGGKKK